MTTLAKLVPERAVQVTPAWPPCDAAFALRVAKAMLPGQSLVYEGENGGGCTADSAFLDYMAHSGSWNEVFDLSDQLDAAHVTFCMDKDHWRMFEKKAAS
jgi:hypothetical protein